MPFTGFNAADYAANACVYDPDSGLLVNPAVYGVSLASETVTNGINLTYTVTNNSATSITPPLFDLLLGWDGSGDALTRRWSAQHRFQARTSPVPFAVQTAWFYGSGSVGNRFATNCVAYDNGAGGTDTVGISSDYPYLTMIGERNSAAEPRVFFVPARDTGSQTRVIPDWIRPGESKTYRFWLRRVATTGEEQALESVQPYVDLMHEEHPTAKPRLLYGRTQCVFLSGPGAGVVDPGDDNRYFRDVGSTRVTEFTGWSELLTAVCDLYGGVEAMRDAHYTQIMFWGASGYAPDLDFGAFLPSIFRNLPDNLRATVSEVADWEAENGIKIFLYFGHTHGTVQFGDFDSAKQNPLETGYYESGAFDTDDWDVWALAPAVQEEYDANMMAASAYFTGMGFDADPDYVLDPWVHEQHQRLAAANPGLYMVGENQKTDRGEQFVHSYFYPEYGEAGTAYEGHCPLMERIHPGHQNIVQIIADGGHPGYNDRVQFVEQQGDCAITIGTLLATADYMGVEENAALSGLWTLDETTGNWTLDDDADERTILIFVDEDGDPQEWPQNHELSIGIADREDLTAIYLPGSGDGLNGYRIGIDPIDTTRIAILNVDEGIFSETQTSGPNDIPPSDFLHAAHGYAAAEPFRLRVRTYDSTLEVYLDEDTVPILKWTTAREGSHGTRRNYGFESPVGGAVVMRPTITPLVERAASNAAEVLVAVVAGRVWYSIGGTGISQIDSDFYFRTSGLVSLTDYDSFIYGADGKYHLKADFTATPPTLAVWEASEGTFPFLDGDDTQMSIAISHIGRIITSGAVTDPQNLFMTATGTPDDFDTASDSAGEALYTGTGLNNKIGEPITCLYSLGREVMLIGCLRSIWRMVGDPALGNVELTPISRGVGVTGQNSAAMVEEGLVATHGPDGVMLVSGLGTAVELSKPVLSEGIQLPADRPRDFYVSVVRDPLNHRVYFFLTPKDQTQGLHFVYDERIGGFSPGKGGFYPIQIPAEMGPTCATYFMGRLFFGTHDGRICTFSDDATDDAGTPIESRMALALIDTFDIGKDTILETVRVLPAMASEDFTVTAFGGRTPEEAFGSDRWELFSVRSGANDPAKAIRRRVRSAAIVIEISAEAGRFAIEEVQVEASTGAPLLRRRRVSPQVVSSSSPPPEPVQMLTGPGEGEEPEPPALPPHLAEAAMAGSGGGFSYPGWLVPRVFARRRGVVPGGLNELGNRTFTPGLPGGIVPH